MHHDTLQSPYTYRILANHGSPSQLFDSQNHSYGTTANSTEFSIPESSAVPPGDKTNQVSSFVERSSRQVILATDKYGDPLGFSDDGGCRTSLDCSCMACSHIGNWTVLDPSGIRGCRFHGCTYTAQTAKDDTSAWQSDLINHEYSHYFMHGEPPFQCADGHCKFTTKRWSDLVRHCKSRHCTGPKEFPCPVPYCKYSGNNGFARKDKLRSHQRNVHETRVMPAPSQGLRAIQPAVTTTDSVGSGSSPSRSMSAEGSM